MDAIRKNYSVFIQIICGFFAVSALLSCSPFAAPDRSAPPDTLPATFSLGDTVAAPEQQWWLVFASPQLNTLISDALAENLSLHVYWARLEQVQARYGIAASGLYPAVSADASATYRQSSADAENSSRSLENGNYSVGLFAGYEVDLWGRIRAGAKSASLNVDASREDLNSAAITVAAEVTRRWTGIIARQREMILLKQQLASNQTYLELVELRFRKSLASALDVMQQQQLVERVQAQIPLAAMEEELLRNELAVLTGRMPHELPDITRQPLPVIDSLPAAGIPAQLLAQRPDIRSALHRLEAADQDLIVARADRLPAIRLTGSAAYNDGGLDRIFDNWLTNLAASLTAPLIDGGRRRAEVDVAAASTREQLALYHQSVLTAIQEVEGSLIREKKIREHIRATEKQLQAAQSALNEAGVRYMNGLNDYLPVLTQLITVQNLEKDLIFRNRDLLDARISLYRAIGGTWTDDLPPPTLSQHQGKK